MSDATSMDKPVITKEHKQLLRLSRRSSIPLVDLHLLDIPESVLNFIPSRLAMELIVVPVHVKIEPNGRRTLYVAVRHPCCEATLRRLEAATGLPVRPLLARPSEIVAALRELYGVSVTMPGAKAATAA